MFVRKSKIFLKSLIIFFILVYIISSTFFSLILTSPKPLSSYDGTAVRNTAESQIGNIGGEKYWRWFGSEKRIEWCACFVSWCINSNYEGVPKFSSCAEYIKWLKRNRLFYSPNITPKPGIIIFFDWNDDGKADHTGIVDYCEKNTVYTIEGNTKDRCARSKYTLDSKFIYGYGAIF